jgi:acetylornithine deacetylase/succinyl-diaminopimelate desuccinylase-like protein
MNAIETYLRDNEPRFIKNLCEYLRFPSISAQTEHREDVSRCAQWLAEHCRQIGLEARVIPTKGNPVVLARTPRQGKASRPNFMVYGHYDVQPVDPLDLWKTPPFEPRIQGRSLFARGASDNKGQHLAHLNAVEAYLKTGTPLPCDLTFVFEGEEEVGSNHLAEFLKANRAALKCQAVVISDSGMPARNCPALTYALRGLAALEIVLKGPSRDLHSGIYGGSLDNPAMALCRMLARLQDAKGRVNVPGFYDDVDALSKFERKQLARLPYSEAAYKKFLGVGELFGERGYTSWEQRTARPTLEINGLTSGYQGEGSKTIIPAWASAKITMRLVPHQNPKRIMRLVIKRLKELCPPTARLSIETGHSGEAYLISPEGPKVQAALRALKTAFGREPLLMREGGSIPIVTDFQNILGAQSLLLGFALPDDNAHSPNEKFDLDCYKQGALLGTCLWPELAAAGK